LDGEKKEEKEKERREGSILSENV